jgi:hypothetical protein
MAAWPSEETLTIRAGALEAVGAELAGLVTEEGDAGVVDQHVQTVVGAEHGLGEVADLIEAGEIGAVEFEVRISARALDLRQHRVALRLVAAVQQDACAVAGQAGGDKPAKAIGGSGDKDGLAGEAHVSGLRFAFSPVSPRPNLARCPRGTENFVRWGTCDRA